MIFIAGNQADSSVLGDHYHKDSIQMQVAHTLEKSAHQYRFSSIGRMRFELDVRSEAVSASLALYQSNFSFSGFHNARCNEQYWDLTPNGGFALKPDANPAAAVSDIYENSHKYATECATAMLVVYYKAFLGALGNQGFSKLFPQIYLRNWSIHDPLLREFGIPVKVAEHLLGDRVYFRNYDVNPATPQWQGENCIVLPEELYYGHGVGIGTADQIIMALNRNRKKNATREAFLMEEASRPDFDKVYAAAKKVGAIIQAQEPEPVVVAAMAYPQPLSDAADDLVAQAPTQEDLSAAAAELLESALPQPIPDLLQQASDSQDKKADAKEDSSSKPDSREPQPAFPLPVPPPAARDRVKRPPEPLIWRPFPDPPRRFR